MPPAKAINAGNMRLSVASNDNVLIQTEGMCADGNRSFTPQAAHTLVERVEKIVELVGGGQVWYEGEDYTGREFAVMLADGGGLLGDERVPRGEDEEARAKARWSTFKRSLLARAKWS